jgi:hypothetical protein
MPVDTQFFTENYCDLAEEVFLRRPSPGYTWNAVVDVAVGENTWRGFHRINQSCSGAADVYRQYFVQNRAAILNRLTTIQNRADLSMLSNDICRDVRARLTNVKPHMLISYNRVRKPVDLYFEHLVAMAGDLEQARAALVPLLFLPLDTQILRFEGLFTGAELSRHGLSRRSSFGNIKSENTYKALQELLTQKAGEVCKARVPCVFHVIYFDLLWGGRYLKSANELFKI